MNLSHGQYAVATLSSMIMMSRRKGGIPGYIFSHEVSVAYLDIPVGASALKDMFDVRLHILNNASEDFPLLDNEVELHLPEGLSVMEAYNSVAGYQCFHRRDPRANH